MTSTIDKIQEKLIADILDIMECKGITRAELARKMGKNVIYVQRLLSDRYCSCPTISTLAQVADALGVTINVTFAQREL